MMKKRLLLGFAIVLSTKFFSQTNKNLSSTIEKIMHQQELAWNSGDIDDFMTAYWNSDSLKFIGKNGITYGWQNTLNNYKKNYPDQEAMGELTFVNNSVEQLSESTFYVIGSWNLNKKNGKVGGFYTLLWKKIKGQWVIVCDHTS